MSTIVRVGNRQLAAEPICQHLSRSHLLPQLLREIIIDEVLAQWQSDNPSELPPEPTQEQPVDLAQLEQSQLSKGAERRIKLKQFKQGIWGGKVGSYYLERKQQLDRVICSVMQIQNGSIAQELYFRIQSGEKTFAELALKYSEGATATDGGKIGPIPIGNLHPDMANQVIPLQPGEISPLFIIGNSYVFVRLEELMPAPFDNSLRESLIEELFEKWLQDRIAREIGLISWETDYLPPDFMTNSERVIEEETSNGVKLLIPVVSEADLDFFVQPQPVLPQSERGDTGIFLTQFDAIAPLERKVELELEEIPEQTMIEPGSAGMHSTQPEDLAHSPGLAQIEPIEPDALAQQAMLERGDTGMLLAELDAIAHPPQLEPQLAQIEAIEPEALPQQAMLAQDDLEISTPSVPETSSFNTMAGFLVQPEPEEQGKINYIDDGDRGFDRHKWLVILGMTMMTLIIGLGAFFQLRSTAIVEPIPQQETKSN